MRARFLFYIIGLVIVSFGVSLTIKADLGAGAWDALNVGLSNVIGLTVGSWVIIVGLVLIFLNAYLLKTKPEFLAAFTIVIVGFLIDFWLLFVLKNWTPTNNYVVLGIGLVTLSIGISIYLQAKFPLIPIDNLMIALKARLKINLMVAKTIGEITALLLAFLFNGPIGIGTLLITFLIGPMIQLLFPLFEGLMKKMSPG